MAETIAIINQKGGSGKTTTCVNLGACLAEMGMQVLIVDLDAQRNATLHLLGQKGALKAWAQEKSVYRALVKDAALEDQIVEAGVKNLSLVPSHIDLAGADVELNTLGREYILREKVKPLEKYFDFILLDCSSNLGIVTQNALLCAEQAIITLQAEYLALEGIAQLIKTLDLIRNRLKWPLEILGTVLTIYDHRKRIHRDTAQKAGEFFKERLFKTIIRDNVKLAEAPSRGLPITLYDSGSYGAEDYRNLAKEVLSYVQNRTRREPVSVL